jgi:two-component system, cell cycle sensor histidine kinase PleC
VIVTFPPERVVAAMAPMADEAPLAPQAQPPGEPILSDEERRRLRRRPLFRAGT